MRKLETARLILNMLDKADMDAFCAYMAVPQYRQNLFLSLPPHLNSMQDVAAEYIRKGHTYALHAKGSSLLLGHIHLADTQLMHTESNQLADAWGITLSFATATGFQSNGLMFEALSAVIAEVERRGVQYLHCVIGNEDARTAHLLEKLGFSCICIYEDKNVTPPLLARDYIRYLSPAHLAITPPDQRPHNVSFPTSGMYGVICCMLRALGHAITDEELALRMELPWLFSCEAGGFRSGTALCSIQWLDLALRPFGYRLCERTVPAEDVTTMLDSSSGPIAMPLKPPRMPKRICVFLGKDKRRYRFENLTLPTSKEAMDLLLTPGEVRKGLDDRVTLFTLQPCTPEKIDMTPYLVSSLYTCEAYRLYLANLWEHPLPRAGKESAIRKHFGALVINNLPLQRLTKQYPLYVLLSNLRGELDSLILGALIRLDFRDLIEFSQIDAIFDQLHEGILDRLAELEYPDDALTKLIDRCPAFHPDIMPNNGDAKQIAEFRYLIEYQLEHKLFPNMPKKKTSANCNSKLQ